MGDGRWLRGNTKDLFIVDYWMVILPTDINVTPSWIEVKFASRWDELYPDIDLWAERKIIPSRRYRFDFVHPQSKVAIEIQGQIWRKGRHNTGTGLLSSYEKLNLAAGLGWRVFQLSEEMITVEWLERIADVIEATKNPSTTFV